MGKCKQLEKLFGRELFGEYLIILAKVFGCSIDSLLKDTEGISIQPLNNMPTDSMISDKRMNSNEFEYHWQKLSCSRQANLSTKLEDGDFSPAYDNKVRKLGVLINVISEAMGDKIVEDLYDAIADQEYVLTYLHYNKGYLDGIKFSLMTGQL